MKINKKLFSFCIITDKKYLVQTLVLLDQLKEYNLYILCADNYSYRFLNKNYINNFKILKTNIIEKFFNLKKIKYNRSYIEYIFTLKSFFIKWIFLKIKKNSYVIYLDSDIFFFSKPELLIKETYYNSVCLTPHRFSKSNYHLNIYGKFNAGFISFKNDKVGSSALNWWAKSCKKECSLKNLKNYTDQKYLEYLYANFSKIKKINNIGFNLAPWNLDSYKISLNDNNQIFINKKKLVFFHFHGFKNIFGCIYSHSLKNYNVKNNKELLNYIYKSYLNILNKKLQFFKGLKSFYYTYNLFELIKNFIKSNLIINFKFNL